MATPSSSSGQTRHPGHGIVETQYYPFIDGLRGVAILMVLALHTSLFTDPVPEEALGTLVKSGGKGVQLFFVLSAFTLFSTSWQRFPHERSPRRNFYIRRAFRILPLWWSAIAIYSIANLRWGVVATPLPPTLTEVALNALFLFGFTPAHCLSVVAGGWSLFVEESFYLFLPLLFAYVLSLERAAILAIALIALSVAWNPICRLILLGNPLWSTFYFFFPFYQWFIFGLGIVLYFVVKKRSSQPALAKPVMRMCDLVVGIWLWAVLISHPIGPDIYNAACGLAALCWAASERGSLWALAMKTPMLRALGRCCFSIYLFHGLLLELAAPWRERFLSHLGLGAAPPEVKYLVCYVTFSMAMLAFGEVCFRLFEKRMVRLGHEAIAWLQQRDSRVRPVPRHEPSTQP